MLPLTNNFGFFFLSHLESLASPNGSAKYSWTGSLQVRAAISTTLFSSSALHPPCSEYPISHMDSEDVKWRIKNYCFAECDLEYWTCRTCAVSKPVRMAFNTSPRVLVRGGFLFLTSDGDQLKPWSIHIVHLKLTFQHCRYCSNRHTSVVISVHFILLRSKDILLQVALHCLKCFPKRV